MQIDELDRTRLRRLAELRVDDARVLSLFLDLDPAEFATPPARRTEISSLLDEAERRAREVELDHDARLALRTDVERAREYLGSADFKGAHGMALYCCGPASLFEAIRLPRTIATAVVIDTKPHVEPLVEMLDEERVGIVLVNRRDARLLSGTRDSLTEVERRHDDVRGQHDQGGWSQPNYQRSIEKDVHDHLQATADAVFAYFKQQPFELLAIGATTENAAAFKEHLHPYLLERLAGRIEVDVESASPDQIVTAIQPLLEDAERKREADALDRLKAGVGRGEREAHGLEPVQQALAQQRVEILLVQEGFAEAGVEDAVEAALAQSADVITVRHHDDLRPLGGIGAVLRY